MRLRKYHGLGNDYLVYEEGPELTEALIRAICDRHTGPGSDGLLVPGPGTSVRIFNPDGSEAERSGNGLRIFARWLVDHRGAPAQHVLRTIAGDIAATVAEQITLDMPPATFEGPVDPAALGLPAELGEAWLVDVGNPHCVFFPTEPLGSLPWRELGARTEHHPRFENRTNVQFARPLGPGLVEARIWERGAGETAASGTSSCAIAVAVRARGDRSLQIRVRMPGGELLVEPSDPLRLTGPVQEVAEIDVDPAWVHARTPEASS